MSRTPAAARGGPLIPALLLLVTLASWFGVVHLAAAPVDRGMSMGATSGDALRLAAFLWAWVVMMAAMMLPSAAPMILLHRAVAGRQQSGRFGPLASTSAFVGGYLLVWALFGVVVYGAGRAADALVSGRAMLLVVPYTVAIVLLAAGVYQFTPLKRVCLHACHSPIGFLVRHWKAGPWGALRMGVAHGWYCSACCWGLMAVLVVAGAMGLAWVVVIALAVALEKLLPRGEWAARGTGLVLIALGVLIVLRPQLALTLRGGM